MKKTVFVLSIAMLAGLLVACNKQNSAVEKTPITIGASILDAEEDATKVDFDKSTYKLTWENSDAIRVYAPYKEELRTRNLNTFNINTTSISADRKSANFKEATPHDWTDAGDAVAFCGANTLRAVAGGTNAYFIQVTWPETQTYSSANNPDKGLLYMASQKVTIVGDDITPLKTLQFRPLSAIIKIPVKDSNNSGKTLYSITVGNGGTVNTLTLKGSLMGWTVSRDTYAPIKDSFYWIASSQNDPANKEVTLTDINTAMNSSVKDYYIVVPFSTSGGVGATLTVTLTPTEGAAKVFTYSNAVKQIQAGYVYNFPVIDWSN